MNLLPAGKVEEVLAGAGASKGEIWNFLRAGHKNGQSYAGIGVASGFVVVLSGDDPAVIETYLTEIGATDAEIMELNTLN